MEQVQSENRSSMECLPTACWRADGTFFNANEALCSLLGYSNADIDAGKIRWPDITPPEYKSLDDQALAEIREHGRCAPFEKEYVGSDGTRIPVLITAAASGDGANDAGMFCAIDLRRRKRLPETDETAADQASRLTARQRLICLLCAYGVSQKRIATLLDIGVRTVELERHRTAKVLGVPTSAATIWAASNRQLLTSSARRDGLLTPAVEEVIAACCFANPIDYACDITPCHWAR